MYLLEKFVSHHGTNQIQQTKKLADTSDLDVQFLSLGTFHKNFGNNAICPIYSKYHESVTYTIDSEPESMDTDTQNSGEKEVKSCTLKNWRLI